MVGKNHEKNAKRLWAKRTFDEIGAAVVANLIATIATMVVDPIEKC